VHGSFRGVDEYELKFVFRTVTFRGGWITYEEEYDEQHSADVSVTASLGRVANPPVDETECSVLATDSPMRLGLLSQASDMGGSISKDTGQRFRVQGRYRRKDEAYTVEPVASHGLVHQGRHRPGD
jgi:hypothetical protein